MSDRRAARRVVPDAAALPYVPAWVRSNFPGNGAPPESGNRSTVAEWRDHRMARAAWFAEHGLGGVGRFPTREEYQRRYAAIEHSREIDTQEDVRVPARRARRGSSDS